MDVGGLAETKWIAEYADLYGVLIAPHCNGMGISFMCNVHAAAAMPKNLVAFEWHRADDPLWADYMHVETPLIQDGEAIPPETPGLSFAVDESFLRQHLAPDETYFLE
jgi:L-alanine-DL-glutamate epimerase-like enolase superfamily enzyme